MSQFKSLNWFLPLILLPLLFLLSGCPAEVEEEEVIQDQAAAVEVTEVESRTLEESISAIGSIEATEQVIITPEVGGRIESVNFRDGTAVSAGEKLFEIESEELRQEVKAARSGLESARSSLERAEKDFKRIENLFQRGLQPEQEYDRAREAYKTARERVNELEARLEQAKERYDDAVVEAPSAGVLGEVMVDTGNVISAGDPLAYLYQTHRPEVTFSVPERHSARVRRGQEVRVRPAALIERELTGEVHFASPAIAEPTRSLQVKAYLQADEELRPGGFSHVELLIDERTDRPVVPEEALVSTREGFVVFRIVDGRARSQEVEVGQRLPGYAEITSGLVPGETIVRRGHMELVDGDPVEIVEEGETEQ